MDTNTLMWQLVLQLGLIAANAVFACAEIAVISMNDAKLDKMAAEKHKGALKLKKLTDQPSKFLSTIQVAITLSGFLGSAFAADNFSEYLVKVFQGWGFEKYMSLKAMDSVAVILITLILSYITLIFGELVPKRVAMKRCDDVAIGLAGILGLVARLFAPLVWLLTASTNGILRLMGIDPNEEDDQVTEEEIRMMVDAGSEKGTIDSDEKEFIQNVFEFDDTDVGEICTHRKDVEILWLEDNMETWAETINNSRHTKFPVCKENADDVVGILDVKSYFRVVDKTRKNVMARCVEEPLFVLETTKADVMFEKMKKSTKYFAVVLDEYGGMCGIVTLIDLVREIMGDFLNEGEQGFEEDIERLQDGSWKILGEAAIKDVCEELQVSIPDDEYDTFGGFVFGCLGSIPEDGSRFELEAHGMHINVTGVKDHCMVSALVKIIEEDTAQEDGE